MTVQITPVANQIVVSFGGQSVNLSLGENTAQAVAAKDGAEAAQEAAETAQAAAEAAAASAATVALRRALFASPEADRSGNFSSSAVIGSAVDTAQISRASLAWALASSGLEDIASGFPRISASGLAVQDARTQLLPNPANPAGWTLVSITRADTGEAAPNGTNWYSLTGSATNASATDTAGTGLALSTKHVVHFLIRQNGTTPTTEARLRVRAVSTVVASADVRFDGDRVTTVEALTAGVQISIPRRVGDGWFIAMQFTSSASTASHNVQVQPCTQTAGQAVDVAQIGLYEGEMSVGPMRATSEPDDEWLSTVSLSGTYTFGVDFRVPDFLPSAATAALHLRADANNALIIERDTSGIVRLRVVAGGVTLGTLANAKAAIAGTDYRATVLVTDNRVTFQCGDQTVDTLDLDTPLPVMTELRIGHGPSAGDRFGGDLAPVFIGAGNHLSDRAASAPAINAVLGDGQSNMAGVATFSEGTGSDRQYLQHQFLGGAWIYYAPSAYSGDYTTGADIERPYAIGTSANNLMSSNGSGLNIGPEIGLLDKLPGNFVFTKYAISGTQLAVNASGEDWNVTSTGELHDKAKALGDAMLADIRARGHRAELVAIWTNQGEADGGTTEKAAEWAANQAARIADYRDHFSTPDLLHAVCRINADATAVSFLTEIRTAQADYVTAEVAAGRRAVLIDLDGIDAKDSDNLHYTFPNYARIGERSALAILRELGL